MQTHTDHFWDGPDTLPPEVKEHLEAYLDGTLQDEALICRIEGHLMHCSSCRDQLAMHQLLHGLSDDAWHDLAEEMH